MSGLSKLADEIIVIDSEEKKQIQFDFAEDLDTGETIGSVVFDTDNDIVIEEELSSSNLAQCTISKSESGSTGMYTLKCIASVSSSDHKYVGRGKIRVL